MEHDDSQHWQIKRCPDQSAADCYPRTGVDGTIYSVICPTCRGGFTVEDDNFVYRLDKNDPAAQAQEPISVVCMCGYDHSGRPADRVPGCGSAWTLTR